MSHSVASKLRYMANSVYNSKLNLENIYLVVKDLIFQTNSLFKSCSSIISRSTRFKSVKNSCQKRKVFNGFFVRIKADIGEIYKGLIRNSIVSDAKKAIGKTSFLWLDSWSIIAYYNSVACSLLCYFGGVGNLHAVKRIVTYEIRQSLLLTLAHKHKCSSRKILSLYSQKIKATNKLGKEISFISSVEVLNIKKGFLIKHEFNAI